MVLKTKVAVFISGTGSNLKNLIKFSKSKNSPIKIDLIISNKLNAAGLNFGRKYNIKRKIFKFKDHKIDEKKLLKYLNKNNITFIKNKPIEVSSSLLRKRIKI